LKGRKNTDAHQHAQWTLPIGVPSTGPGSENDDAVEEDGDDDYKTTLWGNRRVGRLPIQAHLYLKLDRIQLFLLDDYLVEVS
jgi:hypothetical protein